MEVLSHSQVKGEGTEVVSAVARALSRRSAGLPASSPGIPPAGHGWLCDSTRTEEVFRKWVQGPPPLSELQHVAPLSPAPVAHGETQQGSLRAGRS